jgi:ribosomal protein L32
MSTALLEATEVKKDSIVGSNGIHHGVIPYNYEVAPVPDEYKDRSRKAQNGYRYGMFVQANDLLRRLTTGEYELSHEVAQECGEIALEMYWINFRNGKPEYESPTFDEFRQFFNSPEASSEGSTVNAVMLDGEVIATARTDYTKGSELFSGAKFFDIPEELLESYDIKPDDLIAELGRFALNWDHPAIANLRGLDISDSNKRVIISYFQQFAFGQLFADLLKGIEERGTDKIFAVMKKHLADTAASFGYENEFFGKDDGLEYDPNMPGTHNAHRITLPGYFDGKDGKGHPGLTHFTFYYQR